MSVRSLLGCLGAIVMVALVGAAPAERVVTLVDGPPLAFVEIPAGKFFMGSPDDEVGRAHDEGPMREITISRAFWLGKFEVTQAQWQTVMRVNPSTFQDFAASAKHPVEGVSWLDAQEFIAKLNGRGVGRFRLPTEAEWEYASRAGARARFPWGDDPEYRELAQHAWFYSRAEGRSHLVGEKRPSAWGVHDLHGGVWEWCADWFGPYVAHAETDPRGPVEGTARVIRGGSWFNEPEALRSANRHRHPPDSRQPNLGLRLVWEPAEVKTSAAVELRRDGSLPYGFRAFAANGAGPWFVPVDGHVPVDATEHPRLLFRRSDLPALRAKAATPEGRALLQRLRFLLNGRDGETMTTHFNPATTLVPGANFDAPDGTYTIGHAAGYGLLYQLSGDPKFAEFGRECFERALAGARDRDARYSYRQPGGALRAGPTLGWMAVGYDLCYEGWDATTRERLGRALFEYREVVEGARAEKSVIDLPSLVRGTMPPYSNHFSMQVGGAALVLLAVDREPWVDQGRLDPLLEASAFSMVRNLDEGFGDGGFFAEGVGTGSMASQIVFLSALQGWCHAAGRDFINGPRSNARMLTMKWHYQTVYREGRPDFWPVRGGYPHNVWSRAGMSGAAYFAVGMASVPAEERAALAWCYQRFLASGDAANGAPFDTASVYPQFAVSAFVNWPVGEPLVRGNPGLPHVYRDTAAGFFCWRERWQDGDDTVITVLTNEVRGYMGAKPDPGLMVNSRGRHFVWGKIAPGMIRHWAMSARGQTSSLTLGDGTGFAVDFSRASGAAVMLVTTGRAEGQTVGVGGHEVTFFFPATDRPPEVMAAGGAAVVGQQRVTIHEGTIVLEALGR